MENSFDKIPVDFSLFEIKDEETIDEGKVMVTSGLNITGEGCLIIKGMVRIV
jgi:hypothetical protein